MTRAHYPTLRSSEELWENSFQAGGDVEKSSPRLFSSGISEQGSIRGAVSEGGRTAGGTIIPDIDIRDTNVGHVWRLSTALRGHNGRRT